MIAAVFVLAAALTLVVRRLAARFSIIDRPNDRSSHFLPTPRAGGLAIVVSSLLFVGVQAPGVPDRTLLLVLLIGGLSIATIGFLDDLDAVSVSVRFAVHAVAAMCAAIALDGLPSLPIGDGQLHLGVVGYGLAAVAIVWVLNLFNFMDGIDGIAASEAAFITAFGAWFLWLSGDIGPVFSVSLVVSAAALGFLIWNWPPAKIFMGDVGSGYLGYVIAVLALAAAHENSVMIFVWLILGGVFFVDATVTLIRRLLRGEKVYQAHRSHAYQWLARRWGSHLRVTLLVWAVNLFWLLPFAWLCTRYPEYALVFVGVALGPLVPLALVAGAGRAEKRD